MRIDDLVVLGRSSPDILRNGRPSVCTAGYSPKHGFVRLYPTRMDSLLRVWNIVSVTVDRNPQDARPESWKIEGSKADWDRLSEKIEVMGELNRTARLALLTPLISRCVIDIETSGRSLGLVKPSERECYFSAREDHDHSIQRTLLGGTVPRGKDGYTLQPRARYRCSGCIASRRHDQQILEWGIYEWMRKHPGEEGLVWDNLFHNEAKQEILFLVGNQARRPSSFMIVSILRVPRPRDRLSQSQVA